MTTVLIAVSDTDHERSVRAAAVAHQLFGTDADYMVLDIERPSRGHGTVPAAAPMPAFPALVAGPEPTGANHPNAVDVAEQRAGDVAGDAQLTMAQPVGDVGEPVEAILRAVRGCAADVVVLGLGSSRGKRWGRSLERRVVRDGGRPVLIMG